MQNALSTIAHVKSWFFAAGDEFVFWSLYKGTEAKGNPILRNNASESKEKSWELLRDMLEQNAVYGGIFFVHITTKEKGNVGYAQIVSLASQSQSQQTQPQQPYINGIGGGIGEIEKNIREKLELEYRIKELEKSSKLEGYIGAIIQHPNFDPNTVSQIAGGLIGKLIGLVDAIVPKKTPSVVGIAGVPTVQKQPIQPIQPQKKEVEEQEVQKEYDPDKLVYVCDTLGEIYPDVAPENILETLANYIKDNPMYAPMLRRMVGF